MKSYIWLQTADGSIQQVEEEVAMFCPMICREVIQTGMGSSKNYAISLPQRVNPAILGLILDYCRFHQVPGRSNKVRFVSSFLFMYWSPFYLFIYYLILCFSYVLSFPYWQHTMNLMQIILNFPSPREDINLRWHLFSISYLLFGNNSSLSAHILFLIWDHMHSWLKV